MGAIAGKKQTKENYEMRRPKYNIRPRIQVIMLYHCKEEAGSTSRIL